MKHRIILTAIFFVFVSPLCFAQGERGLFINRGQSEFNVHGGIAVSTKDKDLMGSTLEYGGSGYIMGVNGGIYVLERILVGIDFSYSDNGYGNIKDIGGIKYKASTEHLAPMFYVKAQPLPDSPVRLYVPLGIGVDFTKVTVAEQGAGSSSSASGGLMLMGGIGMEVEVSRNTFAGIEARYTYSDYFGRDTAGVSNIGAFNILFKVGMRFDSSDLW
jgi:hypothetical protein